MPPAPPATQREATPAQSARTPFVGLEFDPLAPDDADAWLRARGPDAPFAYVVTPNVEHVVRLENTGDAVRLNYTEADLCLCDSRVLARIASLCGVRLPVVTGSDLVARLLGSILVDGDRVAVVGSTSESVAMLEPLYPHLRFIHVAAPMGLARTRQRGKPWARPPSRPKRASCCSRWERRSRK